MDFNLEYWLQNADSFIHQVFMIVMGGLYGFAWLLGVSYKTINIYCYFILFPLSFSLFLKGGKKYLFLPISLLFFLIPDFEEFSASLFDTCVDFLNRSADIFQSNYIAMSVYLCVVLPLLFYLFMVYIRFGKKGTLRLLGVTGILTLLYFIAVYPNMKSWLLLFRDHYI